MNFENQKEKTNKIQPCAQPPKSWPDALDHLVIGLVDNEYTELGVDP